MRADNGEVTFRVLSYYFSVNWNWDRQPPLIQEALSPFSVPPDPTESRNPPTPGVPPRYSLVDRGAEEARRYSLLYSGAELISGDEPDRVVEHLLWHINSETARRTGDFLLVHAGAVCHANRGVLLPAPTGSGKTTLVAALVREGFGYLSDELGAIDPVARRLYPYPKALAFKEGAPEVNGVRYVSAEQIRPGSSSADCEIRLIIAPKFVGGSQTELAEMSPAETTVELGRNAVNLNLYGSRGMLLLTEIAGRAPGFRLSWGRLEEAVAKVRELLA